MKSIEGTNEDMKKVLVEENKFEKALTYSKFLKCLERMDIAHYKEYVDKQMETANVHLETEVYSWIQAEENVSNGHLANTFISVSHIEDIIREHDDITLDEMANIMSKYNGLSKEQNLEALLLFFMQINGCFMYLEHKYDHTSNLIGYYPDVFDSIA